MRNSIHLFKDTFTWLLAFLFIALLLLPQEALIAQEGKQWVSYQPTDGPGDSKHIVLISGDEEYRSEEALPMLARILASHHGFRTTVLFAIDPETGEIDPDNQTNIPGLEKLQSADLMVVFLRFRELPDEQMQYIDAYIEAGKPIVGLRTSTHAFRYERNPDSPYAKYDFRSTVRGWEDGFGRQILGETWSGHHGAHSREGTRGLIDGTVKRKNHSVLRGVTDIFGVTNVYGMRQLHGNAQVLVWGQPTQEMSPESALNWEKPVMPIAWISHYTSDSGNTGRVFNTTMGASQDFLSEDLRRLLVNACYWAVGMDHQIPEESTVNILGDYEPSDFGFDGYIKGMTPSDFKH